MVDKKSPLPEIGLLYTTESCPQVCDEATECEEIKELFTGFITGRLEYSTLASFYQAKYKTIVPVDRVKEILEVSDEPLPPHLENPEHGSRRKTRQWTPVEDVRLLAAIHKYGMDNWTVVSHFVGHSRSRSQCSQRWQRGLDPRISRGRWTPDEEVALLRLVAEHGERSWIRVSVAMGNRSDVQCRYRYQQIQKGRGIPIRSDEEGYAIDDGERMPIETAKVKLVEPVIVEAMPHIEAMEAMEPVKPVQQEEKGWLAPGELFTIERIGLELGANSMSQLFWSLHL
jgi:hypothetical protein